MNEATRHEGNGGEARRRLAEIWQAIESGKAVRHTSIVVPSLSFDPGELEKIPGASHYEERLLFSLIRLRNPGARVLYVTSQPIYPEIFDYYLHLLAGVSLRQARGRFLHVCLYDASARPLTAKILERPRVVERLRAWIGDHELAYLTCFNSSPLEQELARRLGIPLNGVDPELLWLGTKSGSRKVFAEAGVDHPAGFEDLSDEDQLVDALSRLAEQRPGLRRAVIKLNDSFAGAGNAIFTFPHPLPDDEAARHGALRSSLQALLWGEPGDGDYQDYVLKLGSMGGIVEELVEGGEVRSPSVQMRIDPNGELAIVSSHDQILEGPTGQAYAGCRFPAAEDYRQLIQQHALAIGDVLRRRGVISRFAVDFLVIRQQGGSWQSKAIEINLRMGGTTPPFLALQFLTGGKLDQDSGIFRSSSGREKFYRATDSLRSPAYRGLLPDDLLDILGSHDLSFHPASETGTVVHMIGALSQFGKVGVTCIGNSEQKAEDLYRRVVETLDRETAGGPEHDASPPLAGKSVSAGRRRPPME